MPIIGAEKDSVSDASSHWYYEYFCRYLLQTANGIEDPDAVERLLNRKELFGQKFEALLKEHCGPMIHGAKMVKVDRVTPLEVQFKGLTSNGRLDGREMPHWFTSANLPPDLTRPQHLKLGACNLGLPIDGVGRDLAAALKEVAGVKRLGDPYELMAWARHTSTLQWAFTAVFTCEEFWVNPETGCHFAPILMAGHSPYHLWHHDMNKLSTFQPHIHHLVVL